MFPTVTHVPHMPALVLRDWFRGPQPAFRTLRPMRQPVRFPVLAAALSILAATLGGPAAAHAGVERGQAAPYFAAIESWSSAKALNRAVPGLGALGRAKATDTPPTTEELLSLTFAPKAAVTKAGDAAIIAKLPAGYPTSGVTPQLRKLRASWAKQFGQLPGDLDPDDLADVATVSAIIGLSIHTGKTDVFANPGALAVRAAFRQSLYGSAPFRALPDARKQSAAMMLAVRTLLAFDTYRAERGEKDWKGVRQVRRELRSWLRAGLGVDPAKVTLTAEGLTRR